MLQQLIEQMEATKNMLFCLLLAEQRAGRMSPETLNEIVILVGDSWRQHWQAREMLERHPAPAAVARVIACRQ
jgi:hypothetical protein